MRSSASSGCAPSRRAASIAWPAWSAASLDRPAGAQHVGEPGPRPRHLEDVPELLERRDRRLPRRRPARPAVGGSTSVSQRSRACSASTRASPRLALGPAAAAAELDLRRPPAGDLDAARRRVAPAPAARPRRPGSPPSHSWPSSSAAQPDLAPGSESRCHTVAHGRHDVVVGRRGGRQVTGVAVQVDRRAAGEDRDHARRAPTAAAAAAAASTRARHRARPRPSGRAPASAASAIGGGDSPVTSTRRSDAVPVAGDVGDDHRPARARRRRTAPTAGRSRGPARRPTRRPRGPRRAGRAS